MNYQETISYLFPKAIFGVDYTLYFPVGSTTPTINGWNTAKLGAQPNVATLQQAWDSVLVQQARVAQDAVLVASYTTARYGTPVTIKAASGTSLTFPTDQATQLNVTGYLVAYMSPATPPASMPLVDSSGKTQSITYADLQEIAKATADASVAAFTKLESLQAQVAAADTIAAVQGISW